MPADPEHPPAERSDPRPAEPSEGAVECAPDALAAEREQVLAAGSALGPAEVHLLLRRASAARQEAAVARVDASAQLREAMSALEKTRQAVRHLGASLRRSGISPEQLVPLLRATLGTRGPPDQPLVPSGLEAKAIAWGIEGYYDAAS